MYDRIGELLVRAGSSLVADGPSAAGDERDARSARQIALLVTRVGAMWPHLTRCLLEESAILESALNTLPGNLASDVGTGEHADDPFVRYQWLRSGLDDALRGLRQLDPTEETEACLAALRRAMSEAAAVQGRVVEMALAIRTP